MTKYRTVPQHLLGQGQVVDYNHTLVSTGDLGHAHFVTSWPARPTSRVPVPVPERPLLGPAREMMLQCSFMFESVYGVWRWLGHLARVVQQNALVPMNNTAQAIDEALSPQSVDKNYFLVVYALPDGLRHSLIQGTLAYDYVQGLAVHANEL
ncbi:hypothetical protein B0T20DRAFT_358494, partial [Sordaria brevicollis]